MDLGKLREAEYIGWTYYYSDGWSAEPLVNREAAMAWVMGEHSRDWMITPGPMQLDLVPKVRASGVRVMDVGETE